MYNSYDYDDYNKKPERPLTEAELKAQKIAQKRAYKEQKKALKQKNGTSGAAKFFATVGLAAAFGIVAAFAFKGTGLVFDKLTGKGKASASVSTSSSDNASSDFGLIESKIDKKIKDELADILGDISISSDEDKIEIKKADEANGSVVSVVDKAMPSIVAITNKSIQEIPSFYGMGFQRYEVEGGGSGIIIGQNDTKLLIATNAHVIENAKTITVMFVDSEACEAEVEGSDTIDDIAVISVNLSDIKGSTLDEISVCKVGDSDELDIGEQVVAIGNALGYGQSVTTGIVSALDRPIANEGAGYIQTDAAINPGNSGGALLNMKGELVGINTAKLANTKIEGMGYAIPITNARPIIDDLMSVSTREKVDESEAGYLGISGLSVTQDISSQYNIPIGVYVQEVESGKAADKAGIQSGDVIVKFDGIGMDSMNKLKKRLQYYKAGETVDYVVKRVVDGKYKEIKGTVTLDSREGTVLDPKNKNDADESDDIDEEDDITEDSDDKDAEPNQKSGQFNFGNSTFKYSIPKDFFDFFN